MGLLNQLSKENKIVSIIGMAKNAGKTTALNYLIEEAMDEGMVIGVTSTGRDGETVDLVTGTDKPRVFLDQETLVTVPTSLYELCEAGLEILKMTNYHSSIGQIMICRVVDSGYVQIAGPVTRKEQKQLCQDLLEMGAELVIIDGAIDRKSIASPDASDGVILSTGAVLSRSMANVINQTAHQVNLYNLKTLDNEALREKLKEQDKITIIGDEGKMDFLDLKTGLGGSKLIGEKIHSDTKYVFIPGAFTNSVTADISPKKIKEIQFILKDPTKIFMDHGTWQQMIKKGLKVLVLDNIKVIAVTVNPTAPAGYYFDHKALLEGMEKALPGIPVIDVRL